MPIATLARDTIFDTTDAGHSVLPPYSNSTDQLTIGILATEMLEYLRDHNIAPHPLQTSAYMRTDKVHSITHAILDLTGFPISKSREANGLSVPTGNDVAIAKTFVTAATLAFEAVSHNSDIIRELGPTDIHRDWIRATAESAIDSARSLMGKNPPTTQDDGEPSKGRKKITITDVTGTFLRRHTPQQLTLY